MTTKPDTAPDAVVTSPGAPTTVVGAAAAPARANEGWDYVALSPIEVNGVRAHNVGDIVHVDGVKAFKLDEEKLVAKLGSKAADDLQAAMAEAAGHPTPTK